MNKTGEDFKLSNNPYARATDFSPIVRVFRKIQRNQLCPFENKKFKNCCGSSGQNFCNKAKKNLETYLNKLKDDSSVAVAQENLCVNPHD